MPVLLPVTPIIGHIVELWRYPVKSMRGEHRDTLSLGRYGIEGDRRYAFESPRAPIGKPLLSSVERTAMLRFEPSIDAEGAISVLTPAGRAFALDDPLLLSELTVDPSSTLLHRDRPFTDVRPVALHSRTAERVLAAEISGFDPRRLRSNLVLDLHGVEPFATERPFPEDALSGKTLRLGGQAVLRLLERIPRCRMVSLDPDTGVAAKEILRYLARVHDGRAGIYAAPLTPGLLRVGDPVRLEG